jgi:hypothetical protein
LILILISNNPTHGSYNQTKYSKHRTKAYVTRLKKLKNNTFRLNEEIKNLTSINKFKISPKKQNSTQFEADYKENFIKLIENFLLKHLQRLIQKETSNNSNHNRNENEMQLNENLSKILTGTTLSEQLNADLITRKSSQAPTFTINEKFRSCNLSSLSPEAITECITLESITVPSSLASTTRNETENLIKSTTKLILSKKNATEVKKREKTKPYSNYDYAVWDLKQAVSYYKNYFFYFISIIIFLSTVCCILIVITCISCVINCKQRARLNAYNDNEFFTYYNKNLPVIASVSSFSLTNDTPNGLDDLNPQNDNMNLSGCMPCNSNNRDVVLGANQSRFNMDHHKLSTHLFGNKSSLTLYNQSRPQYEQSLPPQSYNYSVSSINKLLPSANQSQQSFRIMNKFQPCFVNLDSFHSKQKSQASDIGINGPVGALDTNYSSKVNINDSILKNEHRLDEVKLDADNDNLVKEHMNFIAGIRQQNLTLKNSFTRQQEKNIELELNQKLLTLTRNTNKKANKDTCLDDDDEDLVLESEINNQLIENYDKYLFFPNLEFNKPSYLNNQNNQIQVSPKLQHEYLPDVKIIDKIISQSNISEPKFETLSAKVERNNSNRLDTQIKLSNSFKDANGSAFNLNGTNKKSNCIQNEQVTSSPNYIRERYYQILREQVFPFLQRPAHPHLNINQSAKEIQNYSNDVLY